MLRDQSGAMQKLAGTASPRDPTLPEAPIVFSAALTERD
jgi:hypothetical protein